MVMRVTKRFMFCRSVICGPAATIIPSNASSGAQLRVRHRCCRLLLVARLRDGHRYVSRIFSAHLRALLRDALRAAHSGNVLQVLLTLPTVSWERKLFITKGWAILPFILLRRNGHRVASFHSSEKVARHLWIQNSPHMTKGLPSLGACGGG